MLCGSRAYRAESFYLYAIPIRRALSQTATKWFLAMLMAVLGDILKLTPYLFSFRTTVLQSMQLGIDVNRHKVRLKLCLQKRIASVSYFELKRIRIYYMLNKYELNQQASKTWLHLFHNKHLKIFFRTWSTQK